MSKTGAEFFEMKELLMKDKEVKTEYEKLKPRYYDFPNHQGKNKPKPYHEKLELRK